MQHTSDAYQPNERQIMYQYDFNIGHAVYSVVAYRYESAKKHFGKFWIGGYVVTSKGKYRGEKVRNGKCIKVTRK
jgi:hypothetical protein